MEVDGVRCSWVMNNPDFEKKIVNDNIVLDVRLYFK